MGCRDVAHAVKMGYEIDRQPRAIATKDHHSVNACGKKARVYLNTNVVDHGTVRGDTFGSLDAVNAGGDFKAVERDIGRQSINGDTVSRGRGPDLVEGREEVVIRQVCQKGQSSEVST